MNGIVIGCILIALLLLFFFYSGKQKTFLHYRKAGLHDTGTLRELALVAYAQHKETLGEAWKTMEDNIRRPETFEKLMEIGIPFVCEDYNRIVGMAFLIPSGNPDDIFEKDWCCIRMVGVHPDYAGKGIGKELTKLCIAEARSMGETTMALHTSEFMPGARKIYESLGFRILKEIPPRFGKRYWLYTLDLKPE